MTFFIEISWETDKLKKCLWKTDKVEMEVSHTFPISMGDKKKKSYGLLKSIAKGGVL